MIGRDPFHCGRRELNAKSSDMNPNLVFPVDARIKKADLIHHNQDIFPWSFI